MQNEELKTLFKTAALNLTQLYKEGLHQNKKHYVQGYQQCLNDIFYHISSDQINNNTIPVQKLLTTLNYLHQQSNQENFPVETNSLSSPAESVSTPSQKQDKEIPEAFSIEIQEDFVPPQKLRKLDGTYKRPRS